MNGDTSTHRSRRPVRSRGAGVLAVAAGLVLLTAACDASPSSTGSGGPSQASGSSNYQKAVAYSQCMRSNGVPKFPDPSSSGTFPRVNFDVSQSRLQTAENACRDLLPSGSQPSQAQQQQQLNDELKFAQCMRSHGVPNWPDPTNTGGEYEFNLRDVGIDPNSPQVMPAEQRCESQLRLSKSQVHLPGPSAPGGA